MRMEVTHVDGKDKGEISVYALSTCPWCKKTKRLLNQLGVAYDYVDVDLLDGDERDKVENEVKKWTPSVTFPMIVINNDHAIKGYRPEEIKEELGDV